MMSIDSERSTSEPRRKRNKLNKAQHIKEIEKLSRQRREEFCTHKGNLIEAKVTGSNCDCRKKCKDYFSVREKNLLLVKIMVIVLKMNVTRISCFLLKESTCIDIGLYRPNEIKTRFLLIFRYEK